MSRLFTPVEANRTLPLVKRIVADIVDRGRELRELGARRTETGVAERVREIEIELRDLLRELDRIGCSFKDFAFEKGLVDFPARIDGEDVLLCWRSDEGAVTHYHGREEGYDGRRPIPEELLEPEG